MTNVKNRLPLADIVKLIIDHEAAQETVENRPFVRWNREWPLLKKLMDAARAGSLRLYERGEFQSIAPGKLPQPTLLMNREAYLPEVDTWLDQYEPHTPFRFRSHEQTTASSKTKTPSPKQRQVYQEEEILRVIRELGHDDPMVLPKSKVGKSGVKAQVRERLGVREKLGGWTDDIFRDAWSRLMGHGEGNAKRIAYKEE